MNLSHILVLSIVAMLTGIFIPRVWRLWILLGTSLVAVFWLQPSTPIRNLDFWLPVVSIILTVFTWAVTQPSNKEKRRSTLRSALFILGIVVLIGLTRYTDFLCCLTPTPPPGMLHIVMAMGLAFLLCSIPYFLPQNRYLPSITGLILLFVFITLKTETLAQSASAWLRSITGQSTDLASSLDLPWLGFSYLAFRLLHVLRDHQSGKLPDYSLGEFVTYAIFFPTYTAGPIDRSQRFMNELCKTNAPNQGKVQNENKGENLIEGGKRILLGVIRKFVLADSLALIALSEQSAAQTTSSGWMWVLLYAYTLRIYFDFAGYTDIAIGLGHLMDFRLPENFERPYLKQNLTAFWNSWHITLAQWFRAYFFYPLTRSLRILPRMYPAWAIILIGQLSTMILIGLWHGITWNFFIWGAWHGIGLFVHNRWSNWLGPRWAEADIHPLITKFAGIGSWALTFNYVALGWVWFALSNPNLSWDVYLKLAGF